MRVICVKWGTKYPAEWVYRLKAMVSKHLLMPHEFVCMTDQPIEDVHCIPCAPDLPTWWSKVGLFQPGLFPGPNLYLDLDVVITKELDSMVLDHQEKGVVYAPDDFSYSLVTPKQGIGEHQQRLLGGVGTVNSSVMLWHDDAGHDVWRKFQPEKMDEVHGDQNWITQALWPHTLRLLDSKYVCSYKYHVQRGEKPRNVVVFHGDPKVTNLSDRDPLFQAWAA